jgi:signal transduction histidine kinase
MLMDTVWLPGIKQLYIRHHLHKIQNELIQKEKDAEKLLNDAVVYAPERLYNEQENLLSLSRNAHVALYIYSPAGIVLWTNNSIFPSRTDFTHRSFIQRLENGIYLQKNIRSHGFTFITLIPVKYEYAFENKYVRNHLALYQADDINFELTTQNKPGSYAIFTSYGEYLFSLKATLQQQSFDLIGWLFITGTFLLLLFVIAQVNAWLDKRRIIPVLILSTLFLTWSILFWKVFRLPVSVFSWNLFSPSYFAASTIFSSLGDLLVFTFILIFIVWLALRLRNALVPRKELNLLFTGSYLTMLLISATLVQDLIRSLVLDSQISFDLSNIFSLNIFSFTGLFIILAWIFIFYKLLLNFSVRMLESSLHIGFFYTAALLLCLAIEKLLGIFHLSSFLFAGFSVFGFYLLLSKWPKLSSLLIPIFFVLLSALFLSSRFSRYNSINREQNMQLIANKLATERDAVAEYLFSNVVTGIQTDNFVLNFFQSPLSDDAVLEKRLKQLFFSGYYAKYDIIIYSFTSQGLPFKSAQVQPLSYYLSILKSEGTPVIGSSLYFMHTYNALPVYASVIPVYNNGEKSGYLLIQLQEKAFYEESVYPELLLSENVDRLKEAGNYSFAVYNRNVLVNQKGSYPYGGILQFNLPVDSMGNFYFSENGYVHVAHVSEDNVVIVSAPQRSIVYFTTVFSLMLIFSTIGMGINLALPHLKRWWIQSRIYRMRPRLSWRTLSFRNKILITILSGMTLTMLLVGVVTVYYIYAQYNRDVFENLRKKTRSITTELDTHIQDEGVGLTMEGEDFSSFVKQLSRTYQSDINVFDIHGNLVTTTQELIYENNVLAPRMDATAYLRFYVGYVSQLIHDESIGSLRYLSSYMPLRSKEGIITGFVNLPYFSKAEELNDRISSFVVALVNLYLLLLLFLLGIGLIMAQRLTAPLTIIRGHLRNISLDKPNEIIEWQNNDEIGKLIHAYNSLANDLQESAARLAEAGRESGWKDMAQTIAHDIKNPLMPMKLHIQRLQNAQANGTGNLEEMFPKVSEMLIRLIDNLTETANQVNDYAKLSIGNPEKIDLNKVISDVVHLFSHQDETVLHCYLPKESLCVFIDRSQLSRIFNNLVKNALQAIPDGKKGIVQIAAYRDGEDVVIKVEDNGQGIPEENRADIFKPRFSTKTSGTGLGLAIVRRMVELAGGNITFQTTSGAGTTFIIRLPQCPTA